MFTTSFQDTRREKPPSNTTPKLSKSMNVNIKSVGTSNKIFENKLVAGKNHFVVIGPLCSPYLICLKIGFWQSSFIRRYCVFNHLQLKNGTPDNLFQK